MSRPTDPYLSAVRAAGVLAPDRLAELARWAAETAADPKGLARELTRRGWLTPFQVRAIFRGKGADLAVGPYTLLDLLGEGGMGRVYRARHSLLGHEVALKVMRPERVGHPGAVDRFRQEARAAAQVHHPNVVRALDAAEAGGRCVLAMELVDGVGLDRLVSDRGPLPVPVACEYIRQAALGLQHAADRGLVHRDVKPSNLLVTPQGQVKVVDLGLAMLKSAPGEASEERVTREGQVIGTLDFLAPEQARNATTVDPRADVYGLGATLYFLLTGRPPFGGTSPTEKLLRHATDPPPDVRVVRPDTPPPLAELVRAMLGKLPDERPPSPGWVAVALLPFTPAGLAPPPAAGPAAADVLLFGALAPADPPARPRPAAKPYRRTGRRVGVRWLLLSGLGAAAVAAAVGLFLLLRPAPVAPLPDQFEVPPGLRLVRVPGGTFVMGSPDDEAGRDPDEGPVARVTVSGPIFVGATEVTHGQFVAVLGRTPGSGDRRAGASKELPAQGVQWADAVEFCRRLTAADPNLRRGWAYRLPTEAEWEYACRAGTDTPFSFGPKVLLGKQAVFTPAEPDPYAEADPDAGPARLPGPRPAGATASNPFGLHDLHGNVWEWCGDYYARYPEGGRADPAGPPAGDWRVARGGAFDGPAALCRSAHRRGLPPDARDATVGFRVVYAAGR